MQIDEALKGGKLLEKNWAIKGEIELSVRNFIKGSHGWDDGEEAETLIRSMTPDIYADVIIDTLHRLPAMQLIEDDPKLVEEYIYANSRELLKFDLSLFKKQTP